ncbi:hypothetical protein HYV12_02225 [Candidatus Dojkabacteria bacterium]|nr:hypothetical protein [Candidatus Dojkabacteria bacterium]
MPRRMSNQIHDALDGNVEFVNELVNKEIAFEDFSFQITPEETFYDIHLVQSGEHVNSARLSFGDNREGVLSVIELKSYERERASSHLLGQLALGIKTFLSVIGVPELPVEVNIAAPITNPGHPKYIADQKLRSHLQ